MNILMISQLSTFRLHQDFLFQVHLVSNLAALALQLLLGAIIIHVNAVLAKAVAGIKHHMLGLSVPKLKTPNFALCAVGSDGLQSSAHRKHCIRVG